MIYELSDATESLSHLPQQISENVAALQVDRERVERRLAELVERRWCLPEHPLLPLTSPSAASDSDSPK